MSDRYRMFRGLAIVLVLFSFAPCTTEGASTFEQAWQKITRPFLFDLPVFTLTLAARGEAPTLPALNEPRVADPASGPASNPSLLPTTEKSAELRVCRTGPESWCLTLYTPWVKAEIHRDPEETRLVVPDHLIVFSGRGSGASGTSPLAPSGFLNRLLGPETSLQGLPFLLAMGSLDALNKLPGFDGVFVPAGSETWNAGHGQATVSARLGSDTATLEIDLPTSGKGFQGLHHFSLTVSEAPPLITAPTTALHTQPVPRDELEATIMRGLARLLSIRFPSAQVLQAPASAAVSGGVLRPFGEHSLLLLAGSPAQIGEAHGKLLGPAIRRMVDSTIYLVGLVETIQKGKWFLTVLDEAFSRLKPHIPAAHLEELAGIASGCPLITPREIILANIFPEYFHCSGFALFGKATIDGTLYHGRVLDYMTEIGLQQAAVTMIIKPDNRLAFVNVGYAGFVGSVTGMNEKGVSLGEMGGGGRGKWDGIPMSFLMRKALEECSSVDQVIQVWKDSPRTCEYYYVFAQGTPPAAVGIKAIPEAVEVLKAGEAHPQVGAGIPDTVLMSAGSRLKELRRRLEAGHGTFTPEKALRLMDRPVAMRSNLHNALFIPAKLQVWVAHAGPRQPAAERDYLLYELGPLFAETASLTSHLR